MDSSSGGWQPAPVPDPGEPLRTLEVDGELFAVRRGNGDCTHYDWLSGRNEGYGFTSSGSAGRSVEEHADEIRSFLAQVDPITGYIGDD